MIMMVKNGKFLLIVKRRSNILVYLSDGSAETVVYCHTETEVAD